MKLVKILKSEDGVIHNDKVWHLVYDFWDTERTLCGGEAFGEGESNAIFKTKETEQGITCPRCVKIIKFFKSIKL